VRSGESHSQPTLIPIKASPALSRTTSRDSIFVVFLTQTTRTPSFVPLRPACLLACFHYKYSGGVTTEPAKLTHLLDKETHNHQLANPRCCLEKSVRTPRYGPRAARRHNVQPWQRLVEQQQQVQPRRDLHVRHLRLPLPRRRRLRHVRKGPVPEARQRCGALRVCVCVCVAPDSRRTL